MLPGAPSAVRYTIRYSSPPTTYVSGGPLLCTTQCTSEKGNLAFKLGWDTYHHSLHRAFEITRSTSGFVTRNGTGWKPHSQFRRNDRAFGCTAVSKSNGCAPAQRTNAIVNAVQGEWQASLRMPRAMRILLGRVTGNKWPTRVSLKPNVQVYRVYSFGTTRDESSLRNRF